MINFSDVWNLFLYDLNVETPISALLCESPKRCQSVLANTWHFECGFFFRQVLMLVYRWVFSFEPKWEQALQWYSLQGIGSPINIDCNSIRFILYYNKTLRC